MNDESLTHGEANGKWSIGEETFQDLITEHVDDLRKSGLRAETAKQLGIQSITDPGLIRMHLGWHHQGISSILHFPYPNIIPNFDRYKIFYVPGYKEEEDRPRYIQRENSGCHLYMPPLVQEVLTDPAIRLYFTEGEKKALKACQEGYPCIGLGGIWNFLKDGELLSELDSITLTDRKVTLIPDSEVWKTRPDLLLPVYRLGRLLEARGAIVTVLMLPREQKGLDDFLVAFPDRSLEELSLITLNSDAFAEIQKKEASKSFNLTDLGNGERFVSQHRKNIRYVNQWKKWLVWGGERWVADDSQAVRKLARKTVRSIYGEAEKEEDQEQRGKIVAHALKSESDSAMRAMLSLAQMDVPVLPERVDADPWLLNVANGTIDLKTGTLRPHTKGDLLSKIVPVAYDPDASALLWEEFLERIFQGNQELIDWLQRAIGYSLTGLTREQCFFLCHGVGSNGKSTFLNTIMALLGDYSEQATFQTFLSTKSEAVRNDLAKLHTCRFVAAIEAEEGRKLSEVVIKQLTGGDPVTARFLFSEYFTYTPQFKIWLATNHKPAISDTGHAIWRRVKLIPFDVVIPDSEQDETLTDKLKNELPGILAWAVRGCLAWQEQKLKPEPEVVKIATKNYREEEDVLERFISERCALGAQYTAPSSEFHRQFLSWCKFNAEQEISQTALAQRMKGKKFVNERNTITGKKQWKGIALLENRPD